MLWPVVATAEVYQWRDAQGQNHYSDYKPASAEVRNISTALGRINVDSSHRLRAGLSKLFAPMGEIERQWHENKQRQLKAQTRRSCSREQRVLFMLQRPMSLYDAKGKPVYITERQRVEREFKQRRSLARRGCAATRR
tara:strand:- start:370 stop:783 length:414 start_codon:yes stop_codon:yes gene_type:complete